jgi:hypothetical protein
MTKGYGLKLAWKHPLVEASGGISAWSKHVKTVNFLTPKTDVHPPKNIENQYHG